MGRFDRVMSRVVDVVGEFGVLSGSRDDRVQVRDEILMGELEPRGRVERGWLERDSGKGWL